MRKFANWFKRLNRSKKNKVIYNKEINWLNKDKWSYLGI